MTTKIVIVLALLLGAVAIAPAPAEAQRAGQPAGDVEAAKPRLRTRQMPASDPAVSTPARDVARSSGKGMALLFWGFAIACVGGSLFVISRRNLIAAVMGMVATFFGVAAIYMMLFANFLAVIQMLVYAGAIMVLFVFVVMVLNKPEDEPWVEGRARIGKVVAMLGMGYLLLRMATVMWSVTPPDPVAASLAPAPVVVQSFERVRDAATGDVQRVPANVRYDWGSTAAVGHELFTGGLFPFEAISILLLIAVVGAIAIARQPLKDDEVAPAAPSHR